LQFATIKLRLKPDMMSCKFAVNTSLLDVILDHTNFVEYGQS